jgi:hypothetical protein
MAVGFQIEAIKLDGALISLVENYFVAATDQVLEVAGRALDTETKAPAYSVYLRVDDYANFEGRMAAGSPAFAVRILTSTIGPGKHFAWFEVIRADGARFTTPAFNFAVSGAQPVHIVVAGAPKTAGRHVASVLRRYFAIATNPNFGQLVDGEHLFSEAFFSPALRHPFVLHAHPMARKGNLGILRFHGIKQFVTWRNLGDIVISLDDHLRLEPEETWQHTYLYLEERDSYTEMPDQKRYQFLIRNAIPWYLQFYLTWRSARHPLFMRYEWMVSAELAYFHYLIEQLAGSIVQTRLTEIISAGPVADSGVNVGVPERSKSLLSDESKALLEALIHDHPSDLEELYLELPWVQEARGLLDLVTDGDDADVYLLSDGVKRLASDHWIRNKGLDRSAIRPVPAGALADLPRGADLY